MELIGFALHGNESMILGNEVLFAGQIETMEAGKKVVMYTVNRYLEVWGE